MSQHNFSNPSLLSEKPKQAAQIDNLFKLDVKTDNLQHFLENLVQAINKQSVVINKVQEDLRTKADKRQMENCFTKIHSGIKLHDAEFTKNVNYLMGKPLPENTGDMIENASNKCANQTTLLGHACHYLYKTNRDWDQKLQQVDRNLQKKCDIDQMKQKVKKNKRKLLNEIEEMKRKLQKQMDDLTRKCTNQISRFEVSLKETEKKTLWKIQDAEALLQKRVTSEFVDNSLKQLEEKIMREMAKQRDENFGGILRNMEEIAEQVRRVDDTHLDKNKSLKKQIKDLEEQLLARLCNRDTFDNYKKLMQEKMNEIDQKIITLDSKGDAKQLFAGLKDLLRELELKLINLDREEKQLEVKVNELDVKLQTAGLEKNTEDTSGCDPHKLCLLEADVKRMRDEIKNQNDDFKALENQLRRQFQTLEHKVLSNFALLKQNDGSQFSKEEIIAMHERLKIKFEERTKIMQKDIDDLKNKFRLVVDLDKKMKKKFADMENNSEFMRMLSQKADDGEVKREFVHTDEKVRNLAEMVGQMRREFESIDQFFNQLQMLLKTNQQEAVSIITGNQKIIPNRCLACGIKGKQTYNTNDMRGQDGRIYKADVGTTKQTSVYENQEVFDVMPSQMSFTQDQSFTQTNKYGYGQPIQRQDRPTSAKTDVGQDHLPTIKENNQQGIMNQQQQGNKMLIRPTSAKIKN